MSAEREGWEAAESLQVAASPERVWAVVSDIERHPMLAGSGEVLAVRMTGSVTVGATFQADVKTGEVGSFVSRNVIEEASEPTRLGWVSYPPLDEGETEDHQIEVHWSFDLTPTADGGTDVRHGFRVPAPKLGADELASFLERTDRIATVRTGMKRTLENIKATLEKT
jgi:uncharacterized protein YndB with AHSA1/START domain